MIVFNTLYIDSTYSIDRIRFISETPIEEYKRKIPESALLRNTMSDEIVFPADGQAKRYGYKTKLDAVGCNDEFIRILKDSSPEKIGFLSYIEICKDLIFDEIKQAVQYRDDIESRLERKYNKKRFKFESMSPPI